MFKINMHIHTMKGKNSGVGTAYPSGAPEFTPGFKCECQYMPTRRVWR
jgi:hypothetical protein